MKLSVFFILLYCFLSAQSKIHTQPEKDQTGDTQKEEPQRHIGVIACFYSQGRCARSRILLCCAASLLFAIISVSFAISSSMPAIASIVFFVIVTLAVRLILFFTILMIFKQNVSRTVCRNDTRIS